LAQTSGAKEPFRWGQYPLSIKGTPYFYPIFPKIGTYIMHFQWECWNTSLALPLNRL